MGAVGACDGKPARLSCLHHRVRGGRYVSHAPTLRASPFWKAGMEMIRKFVAFLLALFSIVIIESPVRAIIVLGPQGRNVVDSNNPVPYLIDGYSLDQYVGTFGSSLGTPISSKYFVTAYHVNTNSTNDYSFVYSNGTNIPIVYDVHMAGHSNDLAIWEIVNPNQAFDLFASVYTCQDEVGQRSRDSGTRGGERHFRGDEWITRLDLDRWSRRGLVLGNEHCVCSVR